MNAEQAKRLTAAAKSPDNEKVKLVLGCWERAIDAAARAGRTRVCESDVDRPRTPIPAACRAAALDRLRADGFAVRTVATGHNESDTEVSWDDGPAGG